MKELREQLRRMKNAGPWNPEEAWVSRTRAIFANARKHSLPQPLASWSERVSAGLHIFVPHSWITAIRPAMSVVLIGLLAVSGWIASVSASYDSVPGDVLYNVKIAAEKTQSMVVAVAGSNETKTQMHLEFAARRAKEVKQVVAKKEPQHAAVAIESLKKSMVAASDTMKDVTGNPSVEKTVALAKDVNEKSGEIAYTLNQVLKDSTAKGDAALTKEVVEAAKVANDTGIAAVEAAVKSVVQTTTQAAGTGAQVQEVKELVEEKIQTIAAEQKAAGAAVIQATAVGSIPLVTSTIISAVSTTIIMATSTPEKQTIEQAVQKVSESAAAAEGAIAEAKNLIGKNQLQEALQKVKEANQVTQETRQAVVEVGEAVKDKLNAESVPVLPLPLLAPTGTVNIIIVSSTPVISIMTTTSPTVIKDAVVQPKR